MWILHEYLWRPLNPHPAPTASDRSGRLSTRHITIPSRTRSVAASPGASPTMTVSTSRATSPAQTLAPGHGFGPWLIATYLYLENKLRPILPSQRAASLALLMTSLSHLVSSGSQPAIQVHAPSATGSAR